jgi:hypothetical protein
LIYWWARQDSNLQPDRYERQSIDQVRWFTAFSYRTIDAWNRSGRRRSLVLKILRNVRVKLSDKPLKELAAHAEHVQHLVVIVGDFVAFGQASRLNRDHSGSFGSKSYAREELVAEMAGAFVCASLGIVPTVRHADYIGSWLEVLREDNRAVVRAASAASKAADFLLGFLPPAIDSVVGSSEEAA